MKPIVNGIIFVFYLQLYTTIIIIIILTPNLFVVVMHTHAQHDADPGFVETVQSISRQAKELATPHSDSQSQYSQLYTLTLQLL